MNSQLFSSLPCLSLLCFLLVIPLKIQSSSSNSYICPDQFHCGNLTTHYPFWFWGEPQKDIICGHPKFKLDCEEGTITTMMINDVKHRVLEIEPKAQTLRIARMFEYYLGGVCPLFVNTTFDSQLFNYTGAYENVTLHYDCLPLPMDKHSCQLNGVKYEDHVIQEYEAKDVTPGGCNGSVSVPVPKSLLPTAKVNWSDWEEIQKNGFELKWNIGGMPCEDCTNSNGTCGFDRISNDTICCCPDTTQLIFNGPCPYNSLDQPSQAPSDQAPQAPPDQAPPDQAPQAPPESSFTKRSKFLIGIAAGGVGIIIILFIFLKKVLRRNLIVKNKSENCQNMEAFVRNFGSFAPTRYNYSNIKKMTKSFSKKLGQGGYGDIYKGELPDGHLVAVKLLKGSKGNGEEFTNEVASISRTSHVNIVNLLGFCYERNKRALIYEFMPNGSLDKFIYNDEASTGNRCLEWKTIYQIAVGVARGLEYLHRGCNTRIVHFDIKPHNILLDEDFCPKISDFGLVKLCKKKESIVSMLDARGTIGYIAPEVYSRSFGAVSYKSDVYSYGMLIFEMVGGRKNIDVRVSNTSEIYFPHWIYKQLESGYDFEFHGVFTEEEKELTKKMIIVSLWCIQTIPSDRPSMTKVVEMLEADLESLQVPPQPSWASKTRSPQHFSPTSSSSGSSTTYRVGRTLH